MLIPQQREKRMQKSRLLLVTIVLLFFTACSSDDTPQNENDNSGALGIPAGTYSVDKSHAYLTFSYLHQGLSYPLLRAREIDGEMELHTGALEKTRVSIAVAANSIRTNIPYFDQELASPKFFNAEKFPHIVFVADRYEAISDTEGALSGKVTIRGITKPLILTGRINGAMVNPISSKPAIGVSASGYLQRSEFGLDRFIPAVADRVELKIEVEFEQGSNDESLLAANLARSLTTSIGQ